MDVWVGSRMRVVVRTTQEQCIHDWRLPQHKEHWVLWLRIEVCGFRLREVEHNL